MAGHKDLIYPHLLKFRYVLPWKYSTNDDQRYDIAILYVFRRSRVESLRESTHRSGHDRTDLSNPYISVVVTSRRRSVGGLQGAHVHVIEVSPVKLHIVHFAFDRLDDMRREIHLFELLRAAQSPWAEDIDFH